MRWASRPAPSDDITAEVRGRVRGICSGARASLLGPFLRDFPRTGRGPQRLALGLTKRFLWRGASCSEGLVPEWASAPGEAEPGGARPSARGPGASFRGGRTRRQAACAFGNACAQLPGTGRPQDQEQMENSPPWLRRAFLWVCVPFQL